MWNQRERLVHKKNRVHNDRLYEKHLEWLAQHYRLKLKPGWTREELIELDKETGYVKSTNDQRQLWGSYLDYAQLHDRVVCQHLLLIALTYLLFVLMLS